MARVTGALFSASASGNLKKTIVFSRSKGVQTVKGNRLEKVGSYHFRTKPYESQSVAQLSVRETFRNGITDWNNLTVEQKQVYIEMAQGKPMTPISIFMKEYMLSEYNLADYLLAWVFGIGFGIILPFSELGFSVGELLSIED